MKITAYDLAQRFVGLKEIPGKQDSPQILAMLKLDDEWPEDDEVPWCSAFVNYIAWLLRLPRSKSLRARSWLEVGKPVGPGMSRVGFDVVVLSRGLPPAGHVGWYAGYEPEGKEVLVLAGNQGDSVSVRAFERSRILGIRRLA